MTYNEAYNKIIDAYFKDEIETMDPEFCFCGTLASNEDWVSFKILKSRPSFYSYHEYGRMEKALFSPFKNIIWEHNCSIKVIDEDDIESRSDYEDKLFNGMCAALEVLKQIHKDRGENVDEEIPFTKRELLTA